MREVVVKAGIPFWSKLCQCIDSSFHPFLGINDDKPPQVCIFKFQVAQTVEQEQQFPLMIYESSVTMIADSSLSVSTIRVRFLKRLSRPDGLNVVLKVDRSLEVGIAFPP
jgi:hypothetical protein